MEKIFQELMGSENVRGNLSALRQQIKSETGLQQFLRLADGKIPMFIDYLQHEDAKTRKNAALLLGDIGCQDAVDALHDAYVKEQTMFVRAAYLQALAELDVEEHLPELKQCLEELTQLKPAEENKKHIEDEIRALRKVVIRYEGITRHTADIKNKTVDVILLTNRSQKETIRRTITCGEAKLHPLGIYVHTDNLPELMRLRTYRGMVFPLKPEEFLTPEPFEAAEKIWDSNLMEILRSLHKEDGSFYFRIECKNSMTLEERSRFTKKLGAELERLAEGALINSTSDYEVELRLIANKEGNLYPCLKLNTIKNPRFAYRKNAIASSIHPSTAALIMELASEYLRENAQVMDPFCGVGTMLIERDNRCPAREMYATDIFGDAIAYGRENAQLAGKKINFIHRDFFDFRHEYPFDEIVTNMPIRGKKTKQEMDAFYADFFEKAKEILADDAIIVMYTNEIGFVKKQLRLQRQYTLLQETCLQTKNDFYLLIISYKG